MEGVYLGNTIEERPFKCQKVFGVPLIREECQMADLLEVLE
jgi:hypothetical protein